jgi:hypothetical protein
MPERQRGQPGRLSHKKLVGSASGLSKSLGKRTATFLKVTPDF